MPFTSLTSVLSSSSTTSLALIYFAFVPFRLGFTFINFYFFILEHFFWRVLEDLAHFFQFSFTSSYHLFFLFYYWFIRHQIHIKNQRGVERVRGARMRENEWQYRGNPNRERTSQEQQNERRKVRNSGIKKIWKANKFLKSFYIFSSKYCDVNFVHLYAVRNDLFSQHKITFFFISWKSLRLCPHPSYSPSLFDKTNRCILLCTFTVVRSRIIGTF